MRLFGAILLGFFGVLLILFALLGFFAHSLVDSAWMHLMGTATEIAGDPARMALEAGSEDISVWPSLVMALLGAATLAGGIILGASGRRRLPGRGATRPFPPRGSMGPGASVRPSLPRTRTRRRFRF